MSTPLISIPHRPLSKSVEERWLRWYRSRRGRLTWQRWEHRHPALSHPNASRLDRPAEYKARDRSLAALVAIAQGHDPDRHQAALTLMVHLRPGLVALARSTGRPDEEVVSWFFSVALTHDLDRRPRRIAANLVLDTRQRLTRSTTTPLPVPAGAVPAGPDLAPTTDDGSSTVAVIVALKRELADFGGCEVSRRTTVEIAYRAWILEQSHDQIARSVGLQPQAVASRLHRLRRRMRDHLEHDLGPNPYRLAA